MKKITSIFITCFYLSGITAQTTPLIDYFELSDVKLLDSPFKHAEDLDKQYLLDLNVDKLLTPFLSEAGLPSAVESYGNWENTGLDGHIGGHYLSALSLMYASTKDPKIKERLDYMVDVLQECQQANGNGYIGGVPGGKATWDEVKKGNIRAGNFDLNGKWVPLYNIHKTYTGLRDAYLLGENTKTKNMLIQMTDWMVDLVSGLSDDQIQYMLVSEHGGLNEVFADVAVITGDEKYMKLAHQFSHQQILQPLLQHKDELTGMHANTQIPKVLGFKRIADVENLDDWSEASKYFWETVVENRSVSIGGNSVREHFHATNDFSGMIKDVEGPETCNTYNMLRLSKMLYQTSLDVKYMDYYERALYNHILSSQNPNTGGLVYFTQMRPGHYRVYSQPQTSMWCCVGSGMENHAKYGEMIYAHDKAQNNLYVNLFIPSVLDWKDKKVEIIQKNNFPEKSATEIEIKSAKAVNFTMNVRKPIWVSIDAMKVKINGRTQSNILENNGYISINRKWKNGDKVEIEMPMQITVEQMPDSSNYYSFFYGPITLAAKMGDEGTDGTFADDSRGGHIASGKRIPLKDIPILVSEENEIIGHIYPVADKSMTFSLGGLSTETGDRSMELIPFYKLHESRYIIYWPQATSEKLSQMKYEIGKEEKLRAQLDEITVDEITCGEQQPESDHFIKYDNSWTGFVEDVHWRECSGWFSYDLNNKNHQAQKVYIEYFDRDKDRAFSIWLDDEKVYQFISEGNKGDAKQVLYLNLDDKMKNADAIKIRFEGDNGKMSSKIISLRLIK